MTLIFYNIKKKLLKIFLFQALTCMKQNIHLSTFVLKCRKRSKNRADRYIEHFVIKLCILFIHSGYIKRK